jgi:FAD/FMN-containing dehydrogenase
MGEMSRRAMLGGTGKLALAAGAGASARAVSRPRGRRPPDWDRLAGRLRGRLLRPGDRGYAAASTPYNRRYAEIHPAGVALCADAADVAACLTWAQQEHVPFTARSGGHSYGGYSTSRGLIISLAPMRTVHVDERAGTITVGGGARNLDVYAGLTGSHLALPAGRCPTVGLSGLLLGGGFGFSSRHLGLTCDKLLETEVVTAAGEVLQVSPREHADLFWASQGGGGGNFGISTRHTLQGTPVGGVCVYELTWDWTRAAAALEAVQSLMGAAPAELSCRVGLDVAGGGPATGGTPQRNVTALGMFFGSGRELAALLDPVLTAAWPAQQQIDERSYLGAVRQLAHNVPSGRFAATSLFLDDALPQAALASAIRWLERWPGSSNPGGAGLTLFAWGGQIGQVSPAATAFVHRGAAFLSDAETSWTSRDSDRVVAAGLDWLAGLAASLAPFGNGQAYQNFIDPSLRDWRRAYYGPNLARLTRVKHRYDPDNAFRFAQSVPEPAAHVAYA